MEILKSFVINFKANNKPLKDGVKESDSVINNFTKKATKILGGIAIANFTKNAVSNFIELGNTLNQFSNATGISVESVSRLGGALQGFGGDVNTAKSSFETLNQSLEQAKWGTGALIETSKKYGLSIFNQNGNLKDSNELLKSISQTMQGYSKTTQIEIGKSLGLDNSLINLLQTGSSSFENLLNKQNAYGMMNSKDAKAMAEFNSQLIEIKQLLTGVGISIMRYISPPLKVLLNGIRTLSETMQNNKRVVTIALIAIGILLTPLIIGFTKIAIASVIAFAPLWIAIGILTAIALVVEDVVAYFQGANSVTGELVKKFPFLIQPLEIIKNIVLFIKDTFLFILDSIMNFSFKQWIDDLKVVAAYLKSLLPDWIIKMFGGSDANNSIDIIPANQVIQNPAVSNMNNKNINASVSISNNVNTSNPNVMNNLNYNQLKSGLTNALQQSS